MSKPDNAQLELARRCCRFFAEYAGKTIRGMDVDLSEDSPLTALIQQFTRLDAKEQKQQRQGHHGILGGRPRKAK